MKESTDESGGSRRIKTVDKTCDILATLKDLEGARISELAPHIDLSEGSIHTHLYTLQKNGYVKKVDNTYRLDFKLFTMGEHVRNRTKIYLVGRSEVDDLAEKTGEYVHLVVENNGKAIAIYEARGDNAVATEYHIRLREEPQGIHYSATGKAILAHLPDYRVEEIIENHGLKQATGNTITDRETLFEELGEIKGQGYSTNDEEEMLRLRTVAAPVRAHNGGVLGAVGVTAPTSRMKGETFHEEFPELVMQTANVIEVNLETVDIGLDTFSDLAE